MIVLDSSAIMAILNNEPERRMIYDAIWAADRRLVSAVTFQEVGQVLLARFGINGFYDLEDLLALIDAEILPYDAQQAINAIYAFQSYGKGINPKSKLNFCGCAAYAAAKTIGAPLLYIGNDYPNTDIEPAYRP